MKQLIHIILASLIVLIAASCSSSKYSDISVERYKLRKFSRVDDRTYGVDATLTLNNRGRKFSADKIIGRVCYRNTLLGTFYFEPVTVPKGSNEVDFQGKLSIDQGVSLVKLLVIARSFNASDFTFDISAVIKSGIVKLNVDRKEIPLSSLLKKQ